MTKEFRNKAIINHNQSNKPSNYSIFKPLGILLLLLVFISAGWWVISYAMPHIKLITSNMLKSTIGFV